MGQGAVGPAMFDSERCARASVSGDQRQFGRVKVRYRGMKKHTAQLMTLYALFNLWIASPGTKTLFRQRCDLAAADAQ